MTPQAARRLESFLAEYYPENPTARTLVSIEAPKLVCVGVSLRAAAGVLRVLGLRRLLRVLRESLMLLLAGRPPLRPAGRIQAPRGGKLIVVEKGKQKAFLLIDVGAEEVIKALPAESRRAEFVREYGALQRLQEIGSELGPRLVKAHQAAGNDLSLLRMSFHANHRPVSAREWPQFRNETVTPALFETYRAAGPERQPVDRYLAEVTERAARAARPDLDLIEFLQETVLQAAAASATQEVWTALSHCDVREGHVVRNRREWRLVDWGKADTRAVFFDLYVQETKVLKGRLRRGTGGKYARSQVEQMYALPEDNLWSALRERAEAARSSFRSGWHEAFLQHLEAAEGRGSLTVERLRMHVALAELERLGGAGGYGRPGLIALYCFGAPVRIDNIVSDV